MSAYDETFLASSRDGLRSGNPRRHRAPSRAEQAAMARATDKIAARNYVATHPNDPSPFVRACAKKLDVDPGWLPSESQAELLNAAAARAEQ